MSVNLILIFILVAILSVGGYVILLQDTKLNNNLNTVTAPKTIQNIKVPTIVIPKKSIEFSFSKSIKNEYTFSGIFSKEDSPKILIKNLGIEKLEHNININSGLEYNREVVDLSRKLFTELVNNYVEGSIIFKENKLLVTGVVTDAKEKDKIETLLDYSTINSFNSTNVNSEAMTKSDIGDETLDIISNLVRTVDDGESTIAEIAKPKTIIKEKIVIKYKEPKVIIKYKEPKVKIKEKIVIKYKEPIVKEKVIVKYVKVPVKDPEEIKVSKMTKDEYLKKLHSKDPDKDILSLPSVETVDINIEEKIKKGVVKPLKTNKPLVEEGTVYLRPTTETTIDKEIPLADLHDMDEPLNGIVYDDVVAAPSN